MCIRDSAHAVRNRFVHGVYRKIHIPGRLAKQIFVKGMPLMYNEILWAAGTAILNQCYSCLLYTSRKRDSAAQRVPFE